MIISGPSGAPFDARFSVERHDTGLAVVLESRGGSIAGRNARNVDYNPALEALLSRLGSLQALLLDALVDSREVQHLDLAERRLSIRHDLPLAVASVPPGALRLELTRAQRLVNRAPEARGPGNGSRRVRLVVQTSIEDPGELELLLAGPVPVDGRDQTPVDSPGLGDRTSQGYTSDPIRRRLIERRAMDLATNYYQAAGWTVVDVGATESFDLLCTRDGAELHAEVKGTTSNGDQVFLTRNEVAHAITFPQVALAIVRKIEIIDINGVLEAGGGELDLHDPWLLDSGELEPISFRYSLPGHSDRADT